MKLMKPLFAGLMLAIVPAATLGQGSFVYDQESSSDEASPFGSVPIQVYGTVGESFTPSLSTVSFVRLRLFDINPGSGLGATLVVNLRSTAINGPLLGTTTPVTLTNGFVGSVNFVFASGVPVVPNTTYFLEAVVQSGDNWGITTLGDTYAGGHAFGGLQPFTASDVWFREGIVVPEPSSVLLLFLGGGTVAWFARRKR
jgi:hypothetical protein